VALVAAPGAIRPAVKQHMRALENVAVRLPLDREHAFHTKDIRAFVRQQVAQPVCKLLFVQIARRVDAGG
jgi:hypothetical protein